MEFNHWKQNPRDTIYEFFLTFEKALFYDNISSCHLTDYCMVNHDLIFLKDIGILPRQKSLGDLWIDVYFSDKFYPLLRKRPFMIFLSSNSIHSTSVMFISISSLYFHHYKAHSFTFQGQISVVAF